MNNEIRLVNGTKLTLDELAAPDLRGTPRVMTLLREKRLNPEDVPEELLYLKDNSGTSVLDVCIERFKEPLSDDDGQIVPRALFLAGKIDGRLPLHFREIKEILRIAREDGWTVAHEMASSGYLPKRMMTKEILKLTDASGCAVAYHAARWKHFPKWATKRKDILLLGDGRGDYVAHELTRWGKLPSEMMTEDILKLKNKDGCTVAYSLARINLLPDWLGRNKNILLLGDGKGSYVAHALAWKGKLPSEMMTEDILELQDQNGCAVAYDAAWHDSFPDWAKKKEKYSIT